MWPNVCTWEQVSSSLCLIHPLPVLLQMLCTDAHCVGWERKTNQLLPSKRRRKKKVNFIFVGKRKDVVHTQTFHWNQWACNLNTSIPSALPCLSSVFPICCIYPERCTNFSPIGFLFRRDEPKPTVQMWLTSISVSPFKTSVRWGGSWLHWTPGAYSMLSNRPVVTAWGFFLSFSGWFVTERQSEPYFAHSWEPSGRHLTNLAPRGSRGADKRVHMRR